MKEDNWPPPKGTYHGEVKCRHRSKPAEPFGKEGQYGFIHRITPAGRHIPAQAFVEWEDFHTWEKLSDLLPA